MEEINLNLSENEIRNMKKNKFKKYVNNKILLSAFKYLKCIQSTHSKVKNIVYTTLKISSYLIDSKFTIQEKILLFSLRTRMFDVKGNFSNGFADLSCNFCKQNEPQTQQHLLVCEAMMKNCPELANNDEIVYADIFKSTNQQLKCVRLFANILKAKQKLTPLCT